MPYFPLIHIKFLWSICTLCLVAPFLYTLFLRLIYLLILFSCIECVCARVYTKDVQTAYNDEKTARLHLMRSGERKKKNFAVPDDKTKQNIWLCRYYIDSKKNNSFSALSFSVWDVTLRIIVLRNAAHTICI